MLDLLLDCAVYAGVEKGQGNFYQLSGKLTSNNAITTSSLICSGVPLTELQPMIAGKLNGTDEVHINAAKAPPERKGNSKSAIKSPSSITFVRNRMFYARAALNAKAKVRFGLRHIRRKYLLDSISKRTEIIRCP